MQTGKVTWSPDFKSPQILACNKLGNLRRRAERSANGQTCPASRHVELIASALAAGKKYHMLDEEPQHCAASMYSVLESLWKARAEIDRLRGQLLNR